MDLSITFPNFKAYPSLFITGPEKAPDPDLEEALILKHPRIQQLMVKLNVTQLVHCHFLLLGDKAEITAHSFQRRIE